MIEEVISMSQNEINRANIFSQVGQKKISQAKAAEILGLSYRHIRRLYTQYLKSGLSALVSKQRGKPSNHRLTPILRARILELMSCELYVGFGPTFMCEKLEERHSIVISVETTRQIMIQQGIWQVHRKKCPVIHQQRKRRGSFGELTQIDGSPHAWFEDRGDPCVLIVFIDDATGHTFGKFFPSETTEAYMITAREYIEKYGRPMAFYSDRHGIFRVNKPGSLKKELITQFGRATKELDICLICARSPEAKGRVERSNRIQQDRLIKEMRLARINTIEEGNEFLVGYWEKLNKKFSIKPESEKDAHRILLPEHNLNEIFANKYQRTLSKNLEFQYNNEIYQIVTEKPSWKLRRAKIEITECLNGERFVKYKDKYLRFELLSQQECTGKIVDSRSIDHFFKESKKKEVPRDHPWLQQGRAEAKMREYKQI